MQKVYESSTAPEAHIVKIFLESKGIQSRVDGEHLQSGAGGLQAIGIVRVMVADSDFITASEALEQWESERETSPVKAIPKSKPQGLIGFISGVIIASGVLYWMYNYPVTVDGIDFNDDGKLDEVWEFKNNRISKSSRDSNLDGEVDQIYYFSSGSIQSGEVDLNFDGTFETQVSYRRGNIVKQETDVNQNGVVDYRMLFKNGQIDTIEFIDEDSDEVRKRQFYKMGKLVSAEFDADGNGSLEKKYQYDIYEEIK